jgi:hypothetical protein
MTTAPKTKEKPAHTPGQSTTIKFTTTVEFTPEQWAEYKEALWDNYGEEIKTKTEACEWLRKEAEYGLYGHLENQGISYEEVTFK